MTHPDVLSRSAGHGLDTRRCPTNRVSRPVRGPDNYPTGIHYAHLNSYGQEQLIEGAVRDYWPVPAATVPATLICFFAMLTWRTGRASLRTSASPLIAARYRFCAAEI